MDLNGLQPVSPQLKIDYRIFCWTHYRSLSIRLQAEEGLFKMAMRNDSRVDYLLLALSLLTSKGTTQEVSGMLQNCDA